MGSSEKLTIVELQRLSAWCAETAASDEDAAPAAALVQRLVEETIELRQPAKPGARRTVGWAAITKEAAVQTQQIETGAVKPPLSDVEAAAARRATELLERQLAESRRVGKVLIEALQAANASAGWSADRRRTESALAEARKLGWLP